MVKIPPEAFEATFGASVDKANDLIASKTLTISKLMALAPPGTVDPTPYLYDTTMYTMGESAPHRPIANHPTSHHILTC